jgi:hypothetical protein
MSDILFDHFYPACEALFTRLCPIRHNNLNEDFEKDKNRSMRLTTQAIFIGFGSALIEVALCIKPNSMYLDKTSRILDLRMRDKHLGIRQNVVSPNVMALNVPEEFCTKAHADYAASLCLPHMAEVMNEAARHRMPAPASPSPVP